MDFTIEINNYLDRLKTTADSLDREQISNVMNVLLSAYQDNKQVFMYYPFISCLFHFHFYFMFSNL